MYEIERKFLVRSDAYKKLATARHRIRQAYLCFGPPVTLRVRQKDDQYVLTVKGPVKDDGLSRVEVEKTIDRATFEELWHQHRGHPVEKIRYLVPWKGLTIEVDEFVSPRKGLILAEIELPSADTEVELPSWLGEEVTGRPEYHNAYMARHG